MGSSSQNMIDTLAVASKTEGFYFKKNGGFSQNLLNLIKFTIDIETHNLGIPRLPFWNPEHHRHAFPKLWF